MVLNEGKLPARQSLKDLKYAFTVTVPIPVVSRNQLRSSINPIALYLHILKVFSDRKSHLLDNEVAFTNMIAHHFVFLERHWKKLIKVRRLLP